jgi:hypothetical protein
LPKSKEPEPAGATEPALAEIRTLRGNMVGQFLIK